MSVFVCVCLCSSVVKGSSAFAADIITGKLTAVSGEVEVQKRGTKDWNKAVVGMSVGPGDQINTGLTGKATLTFKNSITEIEPFTQFVVGRSLEDGAAITTELFLQMGKVVSTVDPKSGKNNKFSVTTPSAVAGVRGTRQECSFNQGFGTEVKIMDGAGYMAPVRAEALPPAVQQLLNVVPAGGGREGGMGKGDEKGQGGAAGVRGGVRGEAPAGGEKGAEGAAAPAQDAVEAFTEWLSQAEAAAGAGEGAGATEGPAEELFDPGVLEEAMSVGDGLTASVVDAEDPGSVDDPLANLAGDAAPEILPEGSTEAEEEAAQQSTEVVDEPVTITAEEIQEELGEILESTGGTGSTDGTTSVTPPNRPTLNQGQGQ